MNQRYLVVKVSNVCVLAGVGLRGVVVRQWKEVKVLKGVAPGAPPLLCDQH